MEIGRIRVKQRHKNTKYSKEYISKKDQVYQKKKANLLRNTLAHVKKERDYLKKD